MCTLGEEAGLCPDPSTAAPIRADKKAMGVGDQPLYFNSCPGPLTRPWETWVRFLPLLTDWPGHHPLSPHHPSVHLPSTSWGGLMEGSSLLCTHWALRYEVWESGDYAPVTVRSRLPLSLLQNLFCKATTCSETGAALLGRRVHITPMPGAAVSK